jgi:hypothetical protein
LTWSDKILGFKRKLNLWENNVVKGNLEMFPMLLMLDNKERYHRVQGLVDNHHVELSNKMKHYFAFVSKQVCDWVRNPYSNIICSAREVDFK